MTIEQIAGIVTQISLSGALGAALTSILVLPVQWRWTGFKPAVAITVATNVQTPVAASSTPIINVTFDEDF